MTCCKGTKRFFYGKLLKDNNHSLCIRNSARAERVNTWCQQLGKKNVCLERIHTNAAGNGCPPGAGFATPPVA